MCWSFETSIVTFMVVVITSHQLYIRGLPNDTVLAYFIMSYGTMQLLEALIWKGQSQPELNKIASFLACLLLYLHPLAIAYGIKADSNYADLSESKLNFCFMLGYGVLFYGLYQICTNTEYEYLSHPHPENGHLIWDFPNHYSKVILPAAMVICFLVGKPLSFQVGSIIFYLSTAYLSTGMHDSAGSYWCWLVAAYSFIMYFANPYLQ